MILSTQDIIAEQEHYRQILAEMDHMAIIAATNAGREERIALFRNRRDLFLKYYFPEYCKYETPLFHYGMYNDLNYDGYQHLVWCMFRESAKTSLALVAMVIHEICYKSSKNIFFVAHKKEDADEKMFDIAVQLQTNQALIADFGELFYGEALERKQSEKKAAANFITTNGVSCKSASTKQSLRGQLKGGVRPDLVIIDDFENKNTMNSYKATIEVKTFFEEMRNGIDAVTGKVLYLCNRITDTGSVAYLEDMAGWSGNYKFREMGIYYGPQEIISWPDRDVRTNEERDRLNKEIKEKGLDRRPYTSIQQREDDNPNGVFEQEYLNIAQTTKDRYFPIAMLDERIKALKDVHFEMDNDLQGIENWKVWERPIVGRKYMIGCDVSEGIGRDWSVITILDFDTLEQVAEFATPLIDPDNLAEEMTAWARRYNNAYVAWENNAVGVAVTVIIKKIYANLHQTVRYDSKGDKKMDKLGFLTNGNTKPIIISGLRSAIAGGVIKLNSVPLLKELRMFGNAEVTRTKFDPDVSQHFDRVMAMAIAYEMRKHARFDEDKGIIAEKISRKRANRIRNLSGVGSMLGSPSKSSNALLSIKN